MPVIEFGGINAQVEAWYSIESPDNVSKINIILVYLAKDIGPT